MYCVLEMSGYSFEEHSNSFIGLLFPFLFPLSIPRIFVEHIFQDLRGILFALFNNPHLHLVRYDSTDFTCGNTEILKNYVKYLSTATERYLIVWDLDSAFSSHVLEY